MLKNAAVFSVLIIFAAVNYNCNQKNLEQKKSIIILAEDRIASLLKEPLQQYKKDLMNEGYNVGSMENINAAMPPSEIRKLLRERYDNDENLTGAVFVGNIPAPLYNDKKRQGESYWHDYLADFYYMDLDGVWEDSDNNGVLDEHKDTEFNLWNKIRKKLNLGNNCKPEIWVSRIRADKLTSLGDEITLLNNYFQKNHSYRTGKLQLPPNRAFVVSAGVDVLRSGWGARPEKIYSDVEVVQFKNKLADTLKKFLGSPEGYELGIINVFSGPRIHHFNYFNTGLDTMWWKSKDGEKDIVRYLDEVTDSQDFTSNDVKNLQPKVLFYQLLASQTGRHDYTDYISGAYIFSGLGLAAVAGTQHSGAVGVPALFDGLAEGKSIGESWHDGLNYLIDHAEDTINIYWHNDILKWSQGSSTYKAVLIGDGTLRLPERK